VAAYRFVADILPSLPGVFKGLYGFLVGLSFVMSLFFLIGIIYCVEGLKKIRNAEDEIYEPKVEPAFMKAEEGDPVMARRWQSAEKHVTSDNPNDWKQAILEADIILDDLLTKLGYHGETIGEKLQRVVKGDMKSLDEAWEAHKVRNRIAHEGSDFSLNEIEAKRVIAMYKKVFEEFYVI